MIQRPRFYLTMKFPKTRSAYWSSIILSLICFILAGWCDTGWPLSPKRINPVPPEELMNQQKIQINDRNQVVYWAATGTLKNLQIEEVFQTIRILSRNDFFILFEYAYIWPDGSLQITKVQIPRGELFKDSELLASLRTSDRNGGVWVPAPIQKNRISLP